MNEIFNMATNLNEKKEQAPPPGYNATISGASGSNIITNNTQQQFTLQGQVIMGNGQMSSTPGSGGGGNNSGGGDGGAIGATGDNSNTIFVGVGQGSSAKIDYQTKAASEYIKAFSDTLKRNPKLEFDRNDLLRLLSYLEGELQAREVVIATLKSEKIKRYLKSTRSKPLPLNDANAALFRDQIATSGNMVSLQTASMVAQTELDSRVGVDYHLALLENVIAEQRVIQMRMLHLMRSEEEKHKKLAQELEDEKRKHERDTAQGDDIAYGLEIERTKLKQELESEKNLRKKGEKELKKLQEVLDNERARQKQIVLLMLAERKKIVLKYVAEHKRSEDLAQILGEEKIRVDQMAEGLEEESKKALRMEAEFERTEAKRTEVMNDLIVERERSLELMKKYDLMYHEFEAYRKAYPASRMGQAAGAPQIPIKPIIPRSDGMDDNPAASPMMSSVAKVVQPTATVTSVPVSGPTTGIARSIAPGQSIRQPSLNETSSFATTKAPKRKLSNSLAQTPPAPSVATTIPQPNVPNITTATVSTSLHNNLKNVIPSAGGGLATVRKVPVPPLGRGVPPPIPPNRPVIPPKRELSASRLGFNNSKDKEIQQNVVGVGGAGIGTISTTALKGDHSIESQSANAPTLDEELQDFDQVLCSMTIK